MVQPSRRQFLSALSTGGGVLLAGCTSSQTDPGESSPAGDENTPTETPESVPAFPAETTSDACPPFDEARQVVCYDVVDPEAMPLVLVPETQVVQPATPSAFTLGNRSDQRFETNPYAWQLYKRVAGDWYFIMPEVVPQPMMQLAAGEDHTWTVTVETGRVSEGKSIDLVQGADALTLTGLGGGQYAFATDGWFEASSYKDPVALAASFELDADPLELTPTLAITETEWDGETLVARSNRGGPRDDDQRDVYILERIDDEADAESVVIEQVVRDDPLRDTIALSREYDADRVRLEEFSGTVPPFGMNEPRTYEFRGERYRVTPQDGDA